MASIVNAPVAGSAWLKGTSSPAPFATAGAAGRIGRFVVAPVLDVSSDVPNPVNDGTPSTAPLSRPFIGRLVGPGTESAAGAPASSRCQRCSVLAPGV